jgi:hypothetical protein
MLPHITEAIALERTSAFSLVKTVDKYLAKYNLSLSVANA